MVPVLDPLPIVNPPVEVPIFPEKVKVFPDAAAKTLVVPAVKVIALVMVAELLLPVNKSVPPPNVRPDILLIFPAALIESVPKLMVVAPV